MMTLFSNTRAIDLEMRSKFEQFIREQNVRIATWRLVWHQDPQNATRVLMEAMMSCGWRACVLFVQHAMIESRVSPATLFVGLGDGLDYSERDMRITFESRESAEVFKAAFPDWKVRGNGRIL